MSRKLTSEAVVKANEFIAAAKSFQNALTALQVADTIEAEELFGCTFIKVSRIFDQIKTKE